MGKLLIGTAMLSGAAVAGWKAHRYRNEIFDRTVEPVLNRAIGAFIGLSPFEDTGTNDDPYDQGDPPYYASGTADLGPAGTVRFGGPRSSYNATGTSPGTRNGC